MSLAVLADHLASKGRNGDTMLVHMTPEEVHGLHALALAHGGQLTINPETGLPEANFLKKMLPMIAGMALNFIAPGVGTAISGALGITGAAAGAIGTGLAVGGITGLATGSLKQGIMAGLGAYGGASLAGGLQAAGLAGAQEAALSKIPAAELQQVVDYSGLTEQGYKNLIAEQATRDYLGKGAMDRFTSGLGALGSEAGRTAALQGVGGASGLMRAGFMGMAGADAFGQPQTATQMPGSGFKYPPRIRPMSWNQYTGQLEQLPMFSAINQAGLTPAPAPAPRPGPTEPEAQPSGGYNTGGIVALAAGGTPPGMTGSIAEQNVLNTKGWQSRSGLTGIEGLNSNINMWFNEFPQAKETDIRSAMQQYGLSDADIVRATGKTVGELAYKPPVVQAPVPAPAPIVPGPSTPGTQGPSTVFGGDTIIPEYVAPQPQTNVTLGEAFQPTPQTMEQVRTNYEQGGGSTRMPTITDIKPGERTYTQNAVVDMLTGYLQSNPNAQYSEVQKFAQSKGIPEMQARAAYNEFRFSTMTGGTKQAYDYLMGRAPYSTKPFVPGGGPIMKPYAEAVGLAAPGSTGGGGYFGRQTIPTSPTQQNAQGTTSTTGTTAGIAGLTTKPTADTLRSTFDQSIFGKTPLEKAAYYNSLLAKGYDDATIRAAINAPLDENWLALRELAASLKTGAPTAGGGTTTTGGGGVTTLLGGSNTRIDGTKKSDDTKTNTDTSTDTPITDFLFGKQDPNNVPVVDRSTRSIDSVLETEAADRAAERAHDEAIRQLEMQNERGYEPGYDYDVGAGYYGDRPDTGYGYDYDVGTGYYGGSRYNPEEYSNLFRKGGLADVAAAAASHGGQIARYNLGGYSDGGRLLRGPGDGVSDSIPATIGNKQPARLADGEFVIPARIVSEIGNGSTEAGARKLYAMMDRVQRARAKTTGKGKVAKNTRAEKYLPA